MLGWEFPPHVSGGLGTACQGLTLGLAQLGVEVCFVLPRERGGEDRGTATLIGTDRVPVPAPGLRAADRVQLAPALQPVMRPIPSPLRPYLTAAEYARRRRDNRTAGDAGAYGADLSAEVARYARAVAELARAETFDLIHAHDWMTYPAGLLARELSGRPLLCHVHSSEYDRSGERPDPHIRDLEQHGFDRAERIVCVSRYTAALLRRRYRVDERKLRVVHNAVLQERERAAAPAKRVLEGPVVLFLGRVTGQKGPGLFLRAAARVRRALPEAQFVVCGDGDRLGETVERAARLGLARAVHFTGFLGPDAVEHAFGQADVYVCPSRSEPFGIAPLEAVLHGVPVIISRQSGVAEVLGSGLVAESRDVRDLADKILALLRRPALARQLVEDGREEVRRLRWEDSARSLLGVYRELAA